MKMIGYLLIALSFLGASLIAVQEASTLSWAFFVPVVLVGFVGVVMVRMAIRQQTQAKHAVQANVDVIHTALENVIRKVSALNAGKADINPYDMRHKIDDEILADLDDFVGARESIGHKYGLQHYADVMSSYAAGERYLNRVWSASADGYIDEVQTFIAKAEEQFKDAFEQVKKLEAAHP